MRRGQELTLLLLAAAAVSGAATAPGALRDNPPAAHTGGFGEPTCRRCHEQYDLNDSAGSLVVTGFPPEYRAGERFRITLTLSHPQLIVAGFQVAVRFDEGEGARAGTQAGSFSAADSLVMIGSDSLKRIHYVQHSSAGVTAAVVQKGRAQWSFDWIAPTGAPAAVVMHVVANAGNDDFSELGDWIFARTVRSLPAR
jgi:hypothetical protein